MGCRIINFNGEENLLIKIKHHLMNNNPIIISTDTQWGICAIDPIIINQIKKRNNKEVILLLDEKYMNIFKVRNNDPLSNLQLDFINQFWPGQVTVVYNTISYRRTGAEYLNKIIDYCKLPVFCSSANITNHEPISNSNEALYSFKSSEFDILIIVTPNQVTNSNSLPSTIIDINEFKIIREGARVEEIKKFLYNHKIKIQNGK